MSNKKSHFLVIATTSRIARLFIKSALMQGHNVTAMCRAQSDQDALDRMKKVVKETTLQLRRSAALSGVPKLKDMMRADYSIYTNTISAAIDGMKQSRWVETFYNDSVGTEGISGDSLTAWPANDNGITNIIANRLPMIFPVYKNITASTNRLEFCNFPSCRTERYPSQKKL